MSHRSFAEVVGVGVLAIGLILAVTLAGGGSAKVQRPPTPAIESVAHSPSLTTAGDVLRNFEALLRQVFGMQSVCAIASKPGTAIDFPLTNNDCVPLATYDPYFYVFTKSGSSSFHLTNVEYHGQPIAGNYPVPILIGGRLIACNNADTEVLIEYSDSAGFGLGCVVSTVLTRSVTS